MQSAESPVVCFLSQHEASFALWSRSSFTRAYYFCLHPTQVARCGIIVPSSEHLWTTWRCTVNHASQFQQPAEVEVSHVLGAEGARRGPLRVVALADAVQAVSSGRYGKDIGIGRRDRPCTISILSGAANDEKP